MALHTQVVTRGAKVQNEFVSPGEENAKLVALRKIYRRSKVHLSGSINESRELRKQVWE